MARPKETRPLPRVRDPLEAWGTVPTDNPNRDERKRLARMLPHLSNYRRFARSLGEASHELHWNLYEHLRGEPSAVHERLTHLATCLAEARAAVAALGPDARDALRRAAEQHNDEPIDPDSPWRHLGPGLELRAGDIRIGWARRILKETEAWAKGAAKTSREALPSRGRPRDSIARTMVGRLADIWTEQTGTPPTRTTEPDGSRSGGFIFFCSQVMTPIYRAVRSPRGGFVEVPMPSLGSVVTTVLRERGKKSAK